MGKVKDRVTTFFKVVHIGLILGVAAGVYWARKKTEGTFLGTIFFKD